MKKSENGFNGFSAIDACTLLKPSETPVPLYWINSSYPDPYEEHITTNTGVDIFIRPIRPEDAPLLKVMGTVLSENTQMLALGRKLGFNIKKEPGIPEYELSIDFGKIGDAAA